MNDLSVADKIELNLMVSEFDFETPMVSVVQRSVVFRANAEQVGEMQKFLNDKGLYFGEINGKFNQDLRSSLKKFQKSEGLKVTGTLNFETFEKIKVVTKLKSSIVEELINHEVLEVDEFVEQKPSIVYQPNQFVNTYGHNRQYHLRLSKPDIVVFSLKEKTDYLAIAIIFLLLSFTLITAFIFN